MIRYKTRRMLGIWIACLLATNAYGQINGSFEGPTGRTLRPPGWGNCSSVFDGTPDTLPGDFGVSLPASEGNTYLGLITDIADNTWKEGVGQAYTFSTGATYTFTVDLAKGSGWNISQYAASAPNNQLKIWAGTGTCAESVLIWTSPLVSHTSWQKYTFSFTPAANFTYLKLQAHSTSYGAVLIDNLKICYSAAAISPTGLLASRNKTWPVDEVINLKTNYALPGVPIDSVQWKVDYLLNGVTEFTRIIDNPASYAFERGDTVIVRPAYFCGGSEITIPVDGPARPTRIVVDDGFDQKIQAVWPKADENIMIVCEVSVLRGSKTYYKGRTGSNGRLYVQGIKSGDQLVLKSTKLTKPYCEGSFTVSFSSEQATPVSITLSPDFADLGLENN